MNFKIFIYGYYGWKNIGDDAMLYSLLQEIASVNPESKFSILSPIPIVVPEGINVVSYVKPSKVEVLKEIFNSEIFILGGGTHLFDYGNKVNALRVQLRIFLLIFYAKFICKKVYILNNGLGPLETRWGSVLPRLICYMADYISVRDRYSYDFLTKWGLKDKSILSFDSSVLIEPSIESGGGPVRDYKDTLGISVTPVFDIYYDSEEKDQLLIEEISKHVNNWLEQNSLSEVRLFIFHGGLKDDDILITRLLQEKLKPNDRVKLVPYDPDPRKVLSHIGKCSAFIGMKYHSCVFAYIMGKPLLIIEYHPKCRAFAEEIGLPNEAIISLNDMMNGAFGNYFKQFQDHPGNFVARLSLENARKRTMHGLPKFGDSL